MPTEKARRASDQNHASDYTMRGAMIIVLSLRDGVFCAFSLELENGQRSWRDVWNSTGLCIMSANDQ